MIHSSHSRKRVERLASKMTQRSGLLARLGGKSWGWSESSAYNIWSHPTQLGGLRSSSMGLMVANIKQAETVESTNEVCQDNYR